MRFGFGCPISDTGDIAGVRSEASERTRDLSIPQAFGHHPSTYPAAFLVDVSV
jgi:hypothetical protein